MDTRRKIISIDKAKELLVDGEWTVIAGYFDPLTAVEASWIEESRGPGNASRVLAVVLDNDEPEAERCFLSGSVRVQLVAALRMVSAVVVATFDQLGSLNVPSSHVRFVCDLSSEKHRSHEFIQLILSKSEVPVAGSV